MAILLVVAPGYRCEGWGTVIRSSCAVFVWPLTYADTPLPRVPPCLLLCIIVFFCIIHDSVLLRTVSGERKLQYQSDKGYSIQRGGKDTSILLVVKCVHWTTLVQKYSEVATAQR